MPTLSNVLKAERDPKMYGPGEKRAPGVFVLDDTIRHAGPALPTLQEKINTRRLWYRCNRQFLSVWYRKMANFWPANLSVLYREKELHINTGVGCFFSVIDI